jgi:hypothetical protein
VSIDKSDIIGAEVIRARTGTGAAGIKQSEHNRRDEQQRRKVLSPAVNSAPAGFRAVIRSATVISGLHYRAANRCVGAEAYGR